MPTYDIVFKDTEDTKERVKVQALPPTHDSRGYSLDGYDWMETLRGDWHSLPNWGEDGWDAGGWPYIILAVSRTKDEAGPIFGLGVYCEGDLTATYYRDKDKWWEAISKECIFHWRNGQADGPKGLPEDFEQVPRQYKVPMDYFRDQGMHHVPCCSSHGVPMTCEDYRRTHFVEVRPCCTADRLAIEAEAAAKAEDGA